MAIINACGIDKASIEKRRKEQIEKDSRKQQIDLYYKRILEDNRNRLIDALETAEYLSKKQINQNFFSVRENESWDKYLSWCCRYIKIYPYSNLITIGSSGHGIFECYKIVESNNDDYINRNLLSEKDSLGNGAYPERLNKFAMELPIILNKFFDFVNSL